MYGSADGTHSRLRQWNTLRISRLSSHLATQHIGVVSASSFSFACVDDADADDADADSDANNMSSFGVQLQSWNTKGCKLINENAFIHASDEARTGSDWGIRGLGLDWQLKFLSSVFMLLSRTCVATTCCFIRRHRMCRLLTTAGRHRISLASHRLLLRRRRPVYGHTQ